MAVQTPKPVILQKAITATIGDFSYLRWFSFKKLRRKELTIENQSGRSAILYFKIFFMVLWLFALILWLFSKKKWRLFYDLLRIYYDFVITSFRVTLELSFILCMLKISCLKYAQMWCKNVTWETFNTIQFHWQLVITSEFTRMNEWEYIS